METTRNVAAALGVSQQTVRKWCKRARVDLVGRDYLLTPAQVERVSRHIRNAKPGRPAKEKK